MSLFTPYRMWRAWFIIPRARTNVMADITTMITADIMVDMIATIGEGITIPAATIAAITIMATAIVAEDMAASTAKVVVITSAVMATIHMIGTVVTRMAVVTIGVTIGATGIATTSVAATIRRAIAPMTA